MLVKANVKTILQRHKHLYESFAGVCDSSRKLLFDSVVLHGQCLKQHNGFKDPSFFLKARNSNSNSDLEDIKLRY